MNTLGRTGEETAQAYLESRGYHIVACNYRWRGGEVDVIALKDSTLICAEVKTWRSIPLDGLEHAISRRKRHSIIATSKRFLRDHPEYGDHFIRYDLLFVEPEAGNLRHFEDVFQETGAV